MLKAVSAAKRSVYWEVYAFHDDAVGRCFIEALKERASTGVDVRLVVDGLGSYGLSNAAEAELKIAGIELLRYHRLGPGWNPRTWLRRVWFRNHRKVLVVDHATAFIGGVNIWEPARDWDDLHLQINGSGVAVLLEGFIKNYLRSGGSKHRLKSLRQALRSGRTANYWQRAVRFIMTSPFSGRNALAWRRLYRRSLAQARTRVQFVSPYYTPDLQFIAQIRAACRRGVEVHILLPLQSDHSFMSRMAEHFWRRTVAVGAKLFLLPGMNHSKALTVDGHTALVGSMNITARSFLHNEESAVVLSDPAMIKDLNAILENWKQRAVPFTEAHRRSGQWFRRLISWALSHLRGWV